MIDNYWRQILLADVRKVMAEPFFWLILMAPLLMGYLLRIYLPQLADQFSSFDLVDYYPLVVALFILTPPLYYGVILALLVLEEKDEGVLLAVAVTPTRLSQFLFARVLVYTLVSLPLIVVVHELLGVVEISLSRLFLIAVAAALNAPMVVMLLAAFCRNQLEGFVMGKGMGFFVLAPLAMFFVPDYWHLLCGVLPTYWPIIAYYTAAAEGGSAAFFYFAILMSLLVQPLVCLLLYRRFARGLVRA